MISFGNGRGEETCVIKQKTYIKLLHDCKCRSKPSTTGCETEGRTGAARQVKGESGEGKGSDLNGCDGTLMPAHLAQLFARFAIVHTTHRIPTGCEHCNGTWHSTCNTGKHTGEHPKHALRTAQGHKLETESLVAEDLWLQVKPERT